MRTALAMIVAAAIAVLPVLGVAGPATATPFVAPAAAAGAPAAPAVAHSDVDDFSFSSFTADYTLDRDADGRSTLKTVEILVADFPQTDQNHGIRRALVDQYQGAPTDLTVASVTDENGTPLDYETDSEDEFLVLTIASDDFVHGSRTYVITYEQRNVTLENGEGGADEFYWDVNGTGWAQPFGTVTARLHLPNDLASALTGSSTCYRGGQGDSTQCPVETASSGDETVLTAAERDLGPGENVTIAVGFEAGTFVPRDDSLFASPGLALLFMMSVVVLLGAIVAAILFRVLRLRDAPGYPVVVPQYLPLQKPDLLVSSVLVGKRGRAVAATLVGLAVRGVVRLVEEPGQGRKPLYAVEFVSYEGRPRLGSGPRGVSTQERKVLRALFGKGTPGERRTLDPKDTKLGNAMQKVVRALPADAIDAGLQRRPPIEPRSAIGAIGCVGMVATVVFSIVLLASALGGFVPVLGLLLAPFGILTFLLPSKRPLTSAGAEVRDYLLGVRDYLRLAEADRLRMLQSPDGALRGADNVVQLYEQLLPHAVLFKVEEDWARVLGTFYEQQDAQPDWYVGSSAFNAAAFSSGISGLSTSAASSFSGSSTSSSSGGSSGGGFSGGGGGGGGGGGV
ncbi:DUF2207 domain-containing protein [Naasia aerilata]|uniref:DUF2207 domain-containing protein n=1 Tax=Naasia aerilata TaxID=1162966 RepID=A0ABM8GH49_9MICO|nr:DUF2207 domain-containing protein [Naasia aerilata]BDZ47676.1 hypothetical protein GCM10025866_35850 [Naasia aerilata]